MLNLFWTLLLVNSDITICYELYLYSEEWIINWTKDRCENVNKDNIVLILAKTKWENNKYEINQFLFNPSTSKFILKAKVKANNIDEKLKKKFDEENMFLGRISDVLGKNTLFYSTKSDHTEDYKNPWIISNQIVINGNVSGSNIIVGNENNAGDLLKANDNQ